MTANCTSREEPAPRRGAWLAATAAATLIATTFSIPPVAATVPSATGNNAVITVKVGGDRIGTNSVSNLSGVVLGFFDTATGGTPAFTCTSDADGDCSIVVPNTQVGPPVGANRDRRFWVRQISAPTGWFTNPTLRTGQATASGSEQTPYRFQTGTQLRAGQTYTSTEDFMEDSGSSNRAASGGVWQQSRTNPALPPACGLDVALILDLSGSVGADLPNLKSAANTFVDSLVGTPSRMAIFSFSADSPATGATQNFPDLASVSTAGGAAVVKSRYAGWTSGGGTNWDRGLASAAAAAPIYDIAVVITDGNPTNYSTTPVQGSGSFNRLREVENGIFSANALKAQGTRVIAFGVGAGVADVNTGLNLRSISGTVAFNGSNGPVADYYQTTNYGAAGAALRALALGNCEGSLSVVKQIVPFGNTGEDITGATPAGAGWVFDGSTTTPGVGGLPATKTTTGDGTGGVNFPLTFPGGVASAPVGIAETQQPGYTLVTQGGQNAVCTNLSTNQPVPVTNSGALGFVVAVPSTAAVSCYVYNRAPPAEASLEVNKDWVINGVEFDEGTQPTGFLANLTLSGPAGAAPSPQEWGVPRPGYVVGNTPTIDETVELDRTLCFLASSSVTEANGSPVEEDLPFTPTLTQSTNTYTITNVVTCETWLSLDKEVRGGLPADRDPTLWTLTAIAPPGALPGPTGVGGTAETTLIPVTPGAVYQLAESGGDPRFIQVDRRTDASNPLSTGSMDCVELDLNGEVIPGFSDGINGGVAVPLGASVRCTAVNVAATLGLRKVVVNDNGGTAVPEDWELTATPIGDVPPGIGPVTVTGTDALLGELFTIRPNTEYALTETNVPNYVLESLGCFLVPRQSGGNIISVDPLDTAVCTFTNADEPAQLTLVKVVDNGATGRTAVPSDWTLSAAGPAPVSGPGNSPAVTDQPVDPGSYELSEAGPAGYDASSWVCQGGTLSGSTVQVPPAADVTCTITNTAQLDVGPAEQTTPQIRTSASDHRVTPGEPFRDRIHVSGLAAGHVATAVARLYGPFTSRVEAACRTPHLVRSQTLQVGNGSNRTNQVSVNAPGVYTWQVTINADAATQSATHRCGQVTESILVAKPGYVAPAIQGGFSGTIDSSPDLDRRVPTTIEMPGIGMHAAVRREGVVDGRMTLPGDVGEVGWLQKSAGIGDKIGTAVIGGHVSDRHDNPGAMSRLNRAHAGQLITVTKGGKRYQFKVISKATFDRRDQLPHRYFATTGKHRVALVSCTAKVVHPNGHFHYTRYVVVLAKQVHR